MNRLILVALSVGISCLNLPGARAQSVLPTYSFGAGNPNGIYPEGPMVLGPDGNFYGTTEAGGNTNANNGQGGGTVFRVTPGGSLTNLIQFNGTNGANPLAGLTLGPDGNLYGTTEYGGSTIGIANINNKLGAGTVFRISTNGVFASLVSFGVTNGSNPFGGLTFGTDGYLYGTTQSGSSGSSNSYGTVFRVTTNGALTTLFGFGANSTNGIEPNSTLVPGPDGNLYGTTSASSLFAYTPFPGYTIYLPTGNGTIYQLTTNGVLTTLVDLDDYSGGKNPNGSLALGPDGNFYGTTYQGGDNGLGTIYQVTTNGTFTTLASLDGTNGAYPLAGLTLGSDGNFYGVTSGDGVKNYGTVFELVLSPEFITDVANESAIIGDPVTFGCQMSGLTPLTYQWLSNNIPVPSAANSSLTVAPVSEPANNAQFQVVVTNYFGSVTSRVASLSVVLEPNSYAVSNNGDGNYTVLVGSYPSSANRLWGTTNLTLPKADWQLLGTINTDANGLGQFLDTDTAGVPSKFYQLSYP